MKPKIGKYYLLRNNKYYRSIDLQRDVMFKDKVVVKCESSSFGLGGYFGSLVDISELYADMETKNEIVFGENDIISEYKLSKMPLFYIDFNAMSNKLKKATTDILKKANKIIKENPEQASYIKVKV